MEQERKLNPITIKSFTNIEQSRKLAEILPHKSADMRYYEYPSHINGTPIVGYIEGITGGFPCWSLAALLNIIPKRIKEYNVLRIDLNRIDFSIWYDELGYGVNTELPNITKKQPIDACYEMILKLNELKRL